MQPKLSTEVRIIRKIAWSLYVFMFCSVTLDSWHVLVCLFPWYADSSDGSGFGPHAGSHTLPVRASTGTFFAERRSNVSGESVLPKCVLVARARGVGVADIRANLVLVAFLCCFSA